MDRRHDEGNRSETPSKSSDQRQWRIAACIVSDYKVTRGVLPPLLRTPSERLLRRQTPETTVGDYLTPGDSPLTNFIWEGLGMHMVCRVHTL